MNRRTAVFILFMLLGISCFAQTTNWTGNTNSNWNVAGNWDNGIPDTASYNAVIPDVSPNPMPQLDNSYTIGNLTIASGASLTTDGYDLTVTGNLTNAGTLSASTNTIEVTGSIDFTGGASPAGQAP
jgi:hypothetical protein